MLTHQELDKLPIESKLYQRRDGLWGKLTDPAASFSSEAFTQLKEFSYVRRSHDLDKRLAVLPTMRGVISECCFDFIAVEYGDRSRRFESQEAVHVVVLSGSSLLVELSVTHKEQQLSLFTIQKTEQLSSDQERLFLTQIVRKLLHWLWSRLTSFN
jgi:hypothetical protein